jgi:type II secretory pathway component PulJ
MRSFFGKSGFSLMEVNLAVFIMAAGVLAMVSLYPLAYRENSQSIEDVKAAAYADAVFNQIAGVLSARNLTWQEWEQCVGAAVNATDAKITTASGGRNGAWAKYCNRENGWSPKRKSEINSLARQVFAALTSKAAQAGGSASWPVDSDLTCALVAQWGMFNRGVGQYPLEDHSRVTLSMRVARNSGSLFSQPIFLTEIHFQGDQREIMQ